jgi:glycerol-3-phosphate dehydrogenase subunit B
MVVGAGVAGLAAAWSARRAGHEVTVVSAGAGATGLGSGAVDDISWEDLWHATRVLGDPIPRASPIAAEVSAFVADLDLWDLPAISRPWIATLAGRLRPARGHDRALLDLGALEGAEVLVPRADRAGWDADALARAWSASSFARVRRLAFHAVDLPVLRFDDEHRIVDADLAARHDEPARLAWLAAQLRGALSIHAGAGAVLLGPWLGIEAPRAADLSASVGLPCGEALVGAGSPAGLRFEAARDRLLAAAGVARLRDRAERVERQGSALVVSLQSARRPSADVVILAIGGLLGGGVIYAPPERAAGADLPPGGKVPFDLSVGAPVVLAARGSGRLGIVGSMHGPELDVSAWPAGGRAGALESVGVLCEGTRAGDGIHAAGDVIADRPRTILEAVTSGIAAGAAA